MGKRDRKFYDIFWDKQTIKYGVTQYEKYIIHEITRRKPEHVFEVGIGNGWPIGVALDKRDIIVHGCDISKKLISSAKKNLGNSSERSCIFAGEVQKYQGKGKYDVVYCVRTSWYIENFENTISKMISMTKDGYVIFDIMQKESLYHVKQIILDIKWEILRFLGVNLEEHMNLYFYSRYRIERVLRHRGISFYSYSEREISSNKDVWNTPKRIYVCRIG